MAAFLDSHLYFVSLIVELFLYLAGLVFLKKHLKSILISSLLALPQGFLSPFYVPLYWNPPRITFFVFGLEDFLFSFLSGGLIWIGLLLIFHRKIELTFNIRIFFLRFGFCSLFGIIGFTILHFFHIRGDIIAYSVMVLWSATIILYRPKYYKIFVTGSFMYLIIYGMAIKISLSIWPHFISFWELHNLSGILFLKIPVEELIWAFLVGGSWSLAIAFILDLKFKTGFIQPDK